eukprot:TRINITY_DN24882_c0_g3_i1.p1 TRINITY_DN24882_c0_g3~~TRINITY_DN24882_c0_g3_i1.p1  ORF type:complete len:377 (-),score=80.45 TRINITY_DN24882_c0_g3_i1:296-1369(-)
MRKTGAAGRRWLPLAIAFALLTALYRRTSVSGDADTLLLNGHERFARRRLRHGENHFEVLGESDEEPVQELRSLRGSDNVAFAVPAFTRLDGNAATLVAGIGTPALAMLLGGLSAGRLRVSAWGLCASQYFSAGMILAVCGALMKELGEHGGGINAAAALAAGFFVGVGAMIAAKKLTETVGEAPAEAAGAASDSVPAARAAKQKPFPWPLVAAVAIDSLVDGLLLGMIGVETPHALRVMAGATALEMGALGISFSTALLGRSRQAHAACVVGMPVVLTLGGALGALAAAPLRGSPLAYTFLLAFGTAALLYLVTQELLAEAAEARQEVDARGSTVYFLFAGYLLVLVIELLEPAGA